jgi:hypothetical protein
MSNSETTVACSSCHDRQANENNNSPSLLSAYCVLGTVLSITYALSHETIQKMYRVSEPRTPNPVLGIPERFPEKRVAGAAEGE